MTAPVVRNWHASVARAKVQDFIATFGTGALPVMQAVDGFRGVTVLAAREGDPCRVTVQTRWDDMGAVRRFAGETPATAVIPPVMAQFFTAYDPEATFHDELLLEAHR